MFVSNDKLEEVRRSIKRIREEKGLSQRALAKKMRVDPGNYSKLEAGKAGIRIETVFCIADALGVDPVILLGRYSSDFLRLWDLFRSLPEERQAKILESVEEQNVLAKVYSENSPE